MPALALVQNQNPRQNCCECRHINKCRSRYTVNRKPLSDRNDMINLLVCRLQLGINANESAQTLLQLFKPGMINLITSARRRASSVNINFVDMLADMQSYTIECILTKYKIGELNPITNFLFDIKTGYLPKWTQFYIAKHKRIMSRYALAGISPFQEESDTERHIPMHGNTHCDTYGELIPPEAVADEIDLDDDKNSVTNKILSMVNDGVTLTTNEYRVFKFCLDNANDNNNTRMIDGLHIHLATTMSVSRPRITRLYAKAREKIKNLVNRQNYHYAPL